MVELLCPVLQIRSLSKIIKTTDKEVIIQGRTVGISVDRAGVSAHGYFIVTALYPRS